MSKIRPGNRRCGHIDHNALCLPPPKFFITIVFDFRWDDCNTQEKLETIVMQFPFLGEGGKGGGGGGGETRCITVYVKMVNVILK